MAPWIWQSWPRRRDTEVNARAPTAVGACLMVTAVIVAAYLWRALHAERESTAELHSRISVSSPEPPLAPGPDAGVAPVGASMRSAEASRVTSMTQSDSASTGLPSAINHDLLLHPHYREVRRLELRTAIEESFPGLVEELTLTQAESDQFFGLLAEGRVAMEAEAYLFEHEPVDLLAAAQATRNRQIRQRQQNQAVKTLLGDERHARWQAYQQNQSAWLQAGTYGAALASSGMPLDGAQTRIIALAVIEERQRHKQTQMPGAQDTQQAVSRQRVLEAVAPHLDAQQLDFLRDQMAMQDATDRISSR